jgi:hypothetical protein
MNDDFPDYEFQISTQNTSYQIKMGNKFSREFHEYMAYKAYINPCQEAANSPNLGFNIGPNCVSAFCITDDTYVIADDPKKLCSRRTRPR